MGIHGNEVVDRATRNAVPAIEEPLPLALCEAAFGIRKTLRHFWDVTLRPQLQATSLGFLRTDSSPSPWSRSTWGEFERDVHGGCVCQWWLFYLIVVLIFTNIW